MKSKILFIIFILFIISAISVIAGDPYRIDENMELGENDIYNASDINSTRFYQDGSLVLDIDDINGTTFNYTKYANSSFYWDDMNTINATQMKGTGGTLSILTTWFSSLFDTLFGAKDTDSLTEGSTNLYDNESWNESKADESYLDKTDQRFNETNKTTAINSSLQAEILLREGNDTAHDLGISNLEDSNTSVNARVDNLETSNTSIWQNFLNYFTKTETSNLISGNRTEIETSITNNFTELNISNTTNWNAIVELQTSNGTTNIRIDNIIEDNTTWNESKANTLYLNRTSEGLYTSTYNSTYAAWNDSGFIKDWSLTYQEAWNSTYNVTYEANNVSMKGYVDGQIDGLVNLTEAEVITIVDGSGNFSAWGYNYDDMVNTPTALSNFSDDVGYFSDITNFTGTLTDTNYCTYDSTNGIINCTASAGLYDDSWINSTMDNKDTAVNDSWKLNASDQLDLINALETSNTTIYSRVDDLNTTVIDNNVSITNNLTSIWNNFDDYLKTTRISTIISGNRTEIEASIDSNTTYLEGLIDDVNNTAGNLSFNENYTNTLYLNRTSEGLYTTTYNETYEANNVSMKGYVDGEIGGLVNLTEAEVIVIVDGSGNWSADSGDYSTTSEADILYRREDWDNFTGIPTKTPADGETTSQSTADQIYDFVVAFAYASISYVNGQISGLNNLTLVEIVANIDNFSAWDKDYGDLINEPTDLGDFTNNAGFISELLNDTTPQLGGTLDANGNDIQIDSGNKYCFNGSSCTSWVFENTTGVYIVYASVERIKINSTHTTIS